MKLNILGSGGALSIPRPFCDCLNCNKAREKGIPYARTGPSMYLYGDAILFDTPEEIRQQIEREKIPDIRHIFYTHWHPDHTQGLRIIEHINATYPDKPQKTPIEVYIPANAISDFQKYCGILWYFKERGFAEINVFDDRQSIYVGNSKIIPLDFQRFDRVRYGFLIERDSKRVIYAPCSTFEMFMDSYYEDLDVFITEAGWIGDTKETREKLPPGHPWHDHISFDENVEVVRRFKPKRTILTHIDGTRHELSSGDYGCMAYVASQVGYANMELAHDGLLIELV